MQLFPELTDHPEWMNSRDDDSVEGATKVSDGLQDSLQVLQDYLNENPKFDVIAGHSQGALMASILSLLAESPASATEENSLAFKVSDDKRWKAILCMNAPNSYETERHLRHVDPGVVIIPSVRVFGGESDTTWEGQQKMQQVHHPRDFHIVHHEAGHFFPSEKENLEEIAQALDKVVAKEM